MSAPLTQYQKFLVTRDSFFALLILAILIYAIAQYEHSKSD